MYIAYDPQGKPQKFQHAVDWKTVIREKGWTADPPGTPKKVELVVVEGEKIDGIEVPNKAKPEKNLEEIADEIERDPNIILGERKGQPKVKAKIER